MTFGDVTRRGFLSAAGASAALADRARADIVNEAPLRERAARCGVLYGAMAMAGELLDADYRVALARECAIMTPGVEMKWGVTEPRRGETTYAAAESIASFARDNGMKLRGHTAAWHVNLAPWTRAALAEPGGAELLVARVRDVVGHFSGRIAEWDVVNEAIEPRDGLPGGRRASILYRAGGDGAIADCFHAARAADPGALLFYNDYGLEYQTPEQEARRRATLGLVDDLLRRRAPIHGFGLQCHLKAGSPFDQATFRRFLGEIAARGLRISLTELDVDDSRLAADPDARDRAVADHAQRVLDVALDEPAVVTVVSWGLSDRYLWLSKDRPRGDGLPTRGLPLDHALRRKVLWRAMADAFAHAPKR